MEGNIKNIIKPQDLRGADTNSYEFPNFSEMIESQMESQLEITPRLIQNLWNNLGLSGKTTMYTLCNEILRVYQESGGLVDEETIECIISYFIANHDFGKYAFSDKEKEIISCYVARDIVDKIIANYPNIYKDGNYLN